MLRIVAYDIIGGHKKRVIDDCPSFQISGTEVRNEEDEVVLTYDASEEGWWDALGNIWYDWTVESL